MRKNGGSHRRSRVAFPLEPKKRQALKLAEIREALVTAGYNTTAKQAAVLGVGRSTAWWLLNHDKRTGPSAKVIKRILFIAASSQKSTSKSRTVCRGEDPRPVWA
jgi:hypothetical protein